mmetsp:Transcript_56292/g.103025  ORF Transcript_56292/g.103025 Transcript_56292/m.103025 type:complete len:266 (-) Transcript_56292:40-837(-)
MWAARSATVISDNNYVEEEVAALASSDAVDDMYDLEQEMWAARSAAVTFDDNYVPEFVPPPASSAGVAGLRIDPKKRYTGTLKWWDAKKKWGWVTLDASCALEQVPSNTLPVEELQINSGGKRPPALRKGLDVEFSIGDDEEGAPCCASVSLPGGLPITQANLERRKIASVENFPGKVDSFNDWGFGYIKPDTPEDLPPMVQAAMHNEMEQFRKKSPKSPAILSLYFRKQDVTGWSKIEPGAPCTFQVYLDEKGAGACAIHMTGG